MVRDDLDALLQVSIMSVGIALRPGATCHAAEITSVQGVWSKTAGMGAPQKHAKQQQLQAKKALPQTCCSVTLAAAGHACTVLRCPYAVQVLPQDIREPLSCHYNRAYLLEVRLLC